MKKMKKVMAAMLVATMAMSMSLTAFGALYDPDGNLITSQPDTTDNKYDDVKTIKISKIYEATNAETTSPAETFDFSIKGVNVTNAAAGVTIDTYGLPTVSDVTYESGDAGSNNKTKDIVIELPPYGSVGIYTYEISEAVGNTAGVTYWNDSSDANKIQLVVTVIQDGDGKTRVAAVHTGETVTDDNGETKEVKFGNITNEYSAGSLTISKAVSGTLGDRSKKFLIDVTFNAPEGETVKEDISFYASTTVVNNEAGYGYGSDKQTIAKDWNGQKTVTLELAHDEAVTFKNIPYGVTYTVTERDYSKGSGTKYEDGYEDAKYAYVSNSEETITDSLTAPENLKMNNVSETVVIGNEKNGNIDTGINLDNAPYILLLAIAALGMFGFVSKKRTSEF